MKRVTVFLFGAAILTAACGGGGGGGGGGNGPSVTIAKAGAPNGDAQTATVASILPESLKVLVLEDGVAKAGAAVNWSTGNGSVSPASSQTDASGIAETRWTLGQVAGSQNAQATLTGATGSPVGFTATAQAGPPTAFTIASGNNQSAFVNQGFALPLVAKVADQFGNGVAGVTVDWAVLNGPVTLNGGTSSASGPAGLASMNVTAGATTGAALVRASTAEVNGVNLDFDLSVTLAPVQVSAGNIFFRSVKNNTQNPAVDTATVGQPVRWSVTGGHTVESTGSPSFTSSGNLTTGDTYTVTFSTPATYTYQCAIHGAAMTGKVVVIP